MEKRKFLTLAVLELRPLGYPAHSQLLYRLLYPGVLDKNREMGNVQKHNIVTNVPLSQTFRSYLE
jgi:hypothetical protein